MNQKRRKVLHTVLDGLARLRDPIDKEEAIDILKACQKQVDICTNEEEAALDSLSDSFRWSRRYDDMTDNISDLYDASGELDVMIETCQNASAFLYDSIKEDAIKAVNSIIKAINR